MADAEWARAFAAFGPTIPDRDVLARVRRNPKINLPGMDTPRAMDMVADLPRIVAPTLVVVGELDPVAPVEAAEEIAAGLAPGVGRLEVIAGAGHFPWLDEPEAFWDVVTRFMADLDTEPGLEA